MEPTDNLNRDNSWHNNRDLIRSLEDRHRRQAAPEEKDPFSEETPLFAKPYKTDKEDELSRRVKNVLGDWDSRALLSHESPLNPIRIPRKSKSQSQTHRHRRTCSKTDPCEDIWAESSPESPDLPPRPEQNCDSDEGPSNWKAEARAKQSQILPEPAKEKKPIEVPSTENTWKPVVHIYVQSIEGILKEMSNSLSPLLSPLQTPPREETSNLPLLAKESQPDGQVAKEFQKSFGQVAKTSPKSCGQVAEAPLEGHVTSTQSFLERPVQLLSPARQPDWKRKAMKSPEEPPGKKKREDKGDTPVRNKIQDVCSSASGVSFQTERKTVVLPPLPAMTAAQRAPNSTTTAPKSPRTESDDLDLPAVDNPARNQVPLFATLRKVEKDHEELSQGISIGIQESWQEVSCKPRVLPLTALSAAERGNLLLDFSVLGKSVMVQSIVSCQGSAGDNRNPFPVTLLPNEDKTRRPQV